MAAAAGPWCRPRWQRRPRPRPGTAIAFGFLLFLSVAMAAAHPAQARKRGGKLIDLHAAVLAGGLTGGAFNGNDSDLFEQIRGPGFGAELGLRLLVLDLSVRFTQLLGSGGWDGTLSSIMLGPSIEIPLRSNSSGPLIVLRPGLAVGVGFGTQGPVDPPLDAAQVTSRGLLVNARIAVERMFGPVLGLGGEVQGGYHLLYGDVVNAPDSRADGWHLAAFGTVAVHFGI